MQKKFKLISDYNPAWDQWQAIESLVNNFENWSKIQTLLWATGTGKTFTMANIIQKLQKPTLILSHNKTLAAQLATEFKNFFPNNAVHYFISYFDYYQPESYLPTQDLYIEKEATVNMEIQMYRLSTLASLLTRPDVIVIASVSSLYWLGKKEFFKDLSFPFEVWNRYNFDKIKESLIKMQYKPTKSKVEQWMFDIQWEKIEIYSSIEKVVYQLYFNEDKLEYIIKRDSLSWKELWNVNKVIIRPATQFLQNSDDVENIINKIQKEMQIRKKEFEDDKMLVEAQRIEKKVNYDMKMIRETWFTNGIENYTPYFDERGKWEPPNTLFDYFPDDFLLMVDESHMTIPQLQAMPSADRSRKINLINHWFRLPSAIDHRPISFTELCKVAWWYQNIDNLENIEKNDKKTSDPGFFSKADKFRPEWDFSLEKYSKKNSKSLFVSATPADYEKKISDNIVEQIIRPTGLLDPLTYVYPKSWDYQTLIDSLSKLLKKTPILKNLLE